MCWGKAECGSSRIWRECGELKRKMSVQDIGTMIGRGKRVVVEYVALAREYHPEPFEGENQGSMGMRRNVLNVNTGLGCALSTG